MVITAFLLNTRVWPRLRGTVNLAKIMPAIQAWIITPRIDWVDITMIASGHSSVVALQYEKKHTYINYLDCTGKKKKSLFFFIILHQLKKKTPRITRLVYVKSTILVGTK